MLLYKTKLTTGPYLRLVPRWMWELLPHAIRLQCPSPNTRHFYLLTASRVCLIGLALSASAS